MPQLKECNIPEDLKSSTVFFARTSFMWYSNLHYSLHNMYVVNRMTKSRKKIKQNKKHSKSCKTVLYPLNLLKPSGDFTYRQV
jgi:hypothetical protein